MPGPPEIELPPPVVVNPGESIPPELIASICMNRSSRPVNQGAGTDYAPNHDSSCAFGASEN